jgi:hypothetical protein
MKISKIDLSWFRGAAERACLETDNKSVVIYGDNATGKSSFADGFEFIITKGKVEHLAHEYKDTGHKNCLRNTSAPIDAIARAVFEFDTGESVSVLVPHDGSNTFKSNPPAFISTVQSWQLGQHLLRQNEIADFIEKRKKEKYSELSPLLGLDYYEQIASNIFSIRSQVESESNINYLKGAEVTQRGDILKYFPDLDSAFVRTHVLERANKYGISPKEDVFEVARNAIEEIKKKEKDLTPDIQRAATAKRILSIKIIEDLDEFLKIYREVEEIREEVIEYKINILEESMKFAGMQENDTIECPACGRQISLSDFRAHIASELESLKEYKKLKDAIERIKINASLKIGQVITLATSDTNFTDWLEISSKRKVKEAFTSIESSPLNDPKNNWFPAYVEAGKVSIEFLFETLEKELGEAPKEASELFEDLNFFDTAMKIKEYLNIQDDIKKISTLINDLEIAHRSIRNKISEITNNILDVISEDVRRIWKKLHPDEPIEEITLMQPKGSEAAIDIALKFYGTPQPSPRLTLSEGYRNSLGLSIFLAFANQGDTKNHPIILDDIVSSLDSNHRGMVADLLSDELADRQIIILTHDDTWYKTLFVMLNRERWKFFKLLPWQGPSIGIRLSPTDYTFSEAYDLLASNPNSAGNAVRTIMDITLPQYTQKLGLRLLFIWGPKSDDRTNHEFFERLIADGKESLKIKNNSGGWDSYFDALSKWEEADKLLVAWADPSSHGGSISPAEVRRLIEVCQSALDYFKCPQCKTFIWRIKDGDRKLCNCGKIRWN